ncbi:hypothetical protein STEG23_034569 [Scotinomys teguina]
MQIKTTLRYHLTPVRMAKIKTLRTVHVGEDVEQEEHSSTVGGNANWYNHSGNQEINCSEERRKDIDEKISIPLTLINSKVEKEPLQPSHVNSLWRNSVGTEDSRSTPELSSWLKNAILVDSPNTDQVDTVAGEAVDVIYDNQKILEKNRRYEIYVLVTRAIEI